MSLYIYFYYIIDSFFRFLTSKKIPEKENCNLFDLDKMAFLPFTIRAQDLQYVRQVFRIFFSRLFVTTTTKIKIRVSKIILSDEHKTHTHICIKQIHTHTYTHVHPVIFTPLSDAGCSISGSLKASVTLISAAVNTTPRFIDKEKRNASIFVVATFCMDPNQLMSVNYYPPPPPHESNTFPPCQSGGVENQDRRT